LTLCAAKRAIAQFAFARRVKTVGIVQCVVFCRVSADLEKQRFKSVEHFTRFRSTETAHLRRSDSASSLRPSNFKTVKSKPKSVQFLG